MIPPPVSDDDFSRQSTTSYRDIVKSSSIIGGSTAINLIIGMASAKASAMFLGPNGVGIIKLYQSVLVTLRTLSGLGINTSGVREVSDAVGSGDEVRVARTVHILRRLCWGTGLLGWILAATFSFFISGWVSGSHEHALPLCILGAAMLLEAVSGGQSALLQGTRRIAALAKVNILSALLSTSLSILLYWRLGVAGIVPALLAGSALALFVTWLEVRKIPLTPTSAIGVFQSLREGGRFIKLGVAFMWSGLLSAGVVMLINSVIVRKFGVEANGHYNAAWTMSGMFANFILGAMGIDFLPRLTSVQKDHPEMCRLVNAQTEIGLLLALPGVVATLFFAPLAIAAFYTKDFMVAADILPWLTLGVFGRVISWPMGFVVVAKGKSALFALTETFFTLFYVALIFTVVTVLGFSSIGIAFFLLYATYTSVMCLVTHRLIGFLWSRGARHLLIASAMLVAFSFTIPQVLSSAMAYSIGLPILIGTSLYCLRGLVARIGPEHRLILSIRRFPGASWLLGQMKP